MKTTLQNRILGANLTFEDLQLVIACLLFNDPDTFPAVCRAIRDAKERLRDETDEQRAEFEDRMLYMPRESKS